MPLGPPTAEEIAPYKDLTGQVIKLEEFYFAYGGFSEIYKGQWTDPQDNSKHNVAIKTLRGVHTNEDVLKTTTRRLNRETRVWHQLDHPNVLKFLGTCNDIGPSPSLISPLCNEGDVLAYIDTHQDADRPAIVYGVALGLQYLHSKDVVHGDMKCRNILIDDGGKPLLCDFGRSKIINHSGFTTEFAGAARYMAPELLDSGDNDDTNFSPTLSKETDVYAFAMVGLEVLTGQIPFHYIRTDSVVIGMVAGGRRPDRNKSQIPAEAEPLWSILEACWAKEMEDRPTMDDVVGRLSIL